MITKIEPDNFDAATTVQLETDAPDNMRAIHEIEDWATAHGFQRTSEYWLRQAIVAGHRRFRGICFRTHNDERTAIERSHQEFLERSDRFADAMKSSPQRSGGIER